MSSDGYKTPSGAPPCELPARFVHQDERCVAFLSINPMRPGHTLVVPRDEVDHWLDLDPDVAAHLMRVAQRVGKAQMDAFRPTRVGMLIAGMEVPHVHLPVVAIGSEADLDFARAERSPDPAALDRAAEALRSRMG